MAPRLNPPRALQQQPGAAVAAVAAAAQPPPPPPDLDPVLANNLKAIMRRHWGHSEFRALQAEAVAATLAGKDVLIILPTGGGKSLTFQLAPMYRNQICVVVTPLLALCKDQVNACLERDIEAAAWSSETPENVKAMLARELGCAELEDTTLRLLYTTPESLGSERLRDLLKLAHEGGKLCSFAVDEAHTVSEWGHDFRPSYLQLKELRADFPGVPFLAATATATPAMRRAIVGALALRDPLLLQGSFNRPNIALEVRHKELLGDGGRDAAVQDLLGLLAPRAGQCGIVYCRLRATCDWLAGALQEAGLEAAAYHAGKDSQQRARVQQGWSEGDLDVVVATISFGMGIDKGSVRYVCHFDPPGSIEGLYQEAGRGGRDGAPALSVVYACSSDLQEIAKLEKGPRRGAVASVAAYIQEPRCRRRALLSYFGERREGGCSEQAGEQLCDVCRCPKAVLAALAAVEGKAEAAAEANAAAAAAAAAAAGTCAGSEEEGEEGGSHTDPFATARSLSLGQPPAKPRSAAHAPLHSAPLPQQAAAPRVPPPWLGGAPLAGTAAAGGEGLPPRQPLRPLLPNRLKRPAEVPAAVGKQQPPAEQQQQQEQVPAAGLPGSPTRAAPAATAGAPTSAPAALGVSGSGAAAPAAAAGVAKRRPVFRAFKPPRRADPAAEH